MKEQSEDLLYNNQIEQQSHPSLQPFQPHFGTNNALKCGGDIPGTHRVGNILVEHGQLYFAGRVELLGLWSRPGGL